LQFLRQVTNPETFGYTLVYGVKLHWQQWLPFIFLRNWNYWMWKYSLQGIEGNTYGKWFAWKTKKEMGG